MTPPHRVGNFECILQQKKTTLELGILVKTKFVHFVISIPWILAIFQYLERVVLVVEVLDRHPFRTPHFTHFRLHLHVYGYNNDEKWRPKHNLLRL